MNLPERKRQILKAIIESYIDTAEPVGSKAVQSSFDIPISSATIRNEMSELEELGFLEKPHVSAGRVPSWAAYRLYVNELMEAHRIAATELDRMRLRMQQSMRELDNIMISASKVMSELTNLTTVSLLSRGGERVKRCELITADEGMSYAVVLVTGVDVKTKMLRLQNPISTDMAAMLCTAINLAISEGRLSYLLNSVSQSMGAASEVYYFAQSIIMFIEQVESDSGFTDVYVDGAARLLDNVEYRDARRAAGLLEYISDKNKMQELLEHEHEQPIQVLIGPELEDPSMKDASIVFTTYDIDKRTKGIIGIIAPTRMDYSAVCAKLAAFAKAMSQRQRQIEKTGEQDER